MFRNKRLNEKHNRLIIRAISHNIYQNQSNRQKYFEHPHTICGYNSVVYQKNNQNFPLGPNSRAAFVPKRFRDRPNSVTNPALVLSTPPKKIFHYTYSISSLVPCQKTRVHTQPRLLYAVEATTRPATTRRSPLGNARIWPASHPHTIFVGARTHRARHAPRTNDRMNDRTKDRFIGISKERLRLPRVDERFQEWWLHFEAFVAAFRPRTSDRSKGKREGRDEEKEKESVLATFQDHTNVLRQPRARGRADFLWRTYACSLCDGRNMYYCICAQGVTSNARQRFFAHLQTM